MPFSSLSDPADLARAYAAFEAVWEKVRHSIPDGEHDLERARLACLVAACAPLALDEEDLKLSVLLHIRRRIEDALDAPFAGLLVVENG